MITEAYVDFRTARLLKEKGFDEGCRSYFRFKDEHNEWRNCAVIITSKDLAEDELLRPTQQMAMKWLREVHKLLISVDASPIYGKVRDEKGRNTCGLLY